MTNFITHTRETASDDGPEVLDAVEARFDFIANLLGNMAEAPASAVA